MTESPQRRKTVCNRDCPDACSIVADVQSDRVVALRGDPDHPVTQGHLCFRTSQFLKRQYAPDRIVRPLLRRNNDWVQIPLNEALDLAAQKLLEIRNESGPASIFHYRSGGSLGVLKYVTDYFFEQFGPTTVKKGDVCSGAGDFAQLEDFGEEDSHDIFDLFHSKTIINWGKNLHASNLHLLGIVREAKAKGAKLITIDPVRTRSADMSHHFLQIRPGADVLLALGVAQILFRTGRICPIWLQRCDHVEAFRSLCMEQTIETLCKKTDLPLEAFELLADALSDRPTSILVGWGMQRHAHGAEQVRMLDALSAISGNLGRPGGGVSFYFKRRGIFDLSFVGQKQPPRTINEPLFGQEVLAAKAPPIRLLWITAGNPVAMLPDSRKVAEAIESTEFVVAVDAFHTDTTRRAHLILPCATLLEDDDLLGAYGHHYVQASNPVVPKPEEVLTDFEIIQQLAPRVGLAHLFQESPLEWKRKILKNASTFGLTAEALSQGPMKNPLAQEVLFSEGKVKTPNGKVNLIHHLPAVDEVDDLYPFTLMSNSTEKSQSSQWAVATLGRIQVRIHPESTTMADGSHARLVNKLGHIEVELHHDATQRRDVILIPKGGHYDNGWAANALVEARPTDNGDGAAYLSTKVRVEALT